MQFMVPGRSAWVNGQQRYSLSLRSRRKWPNLFSGLQGYTTIQRFYIIHFYNSDFDKKHSYTGIITLNY